MVVTDTQSVVLQLLYQKFITFSLKKLRLLGLDELKATLAPYFASNLNCEGGIKSRCRSYLDTFLLKALVSLMANLHRRIALLFLRASPVLI